METIQRILSPIAVTLLCLFAVLVVAPSVGAESLFEPAKEQACKGANVGPSGSCHKEAAGQDIDDVIKFIVNVLTVIVGVVAVIMIIVNGLRFITSNGDANTVAAAKNGIIYAIVGLIIVALSQVIVRFVIDKV